MLKRRERWRRVAGRRRGVVRLVERRIEVVVERLEGPRIAVAVERSEERRRW